jgi:hypothetical protein
MMLKIIEMDENVTLGAQLEESCKHENFKAKNTIQFFTKGPTLTIKSRVQHHALFYALFHI